VANVLWTVLLVVCLLVALITFLWLLVDDPASPTGATTDSGTKPRSTAKYDQKASDWLVSLIDLLFALVLTVPVLIAEDVVRSPWHSNIQIVLALGVGYYVVIRSFVDWHIAMDDAPYRIRSRGVRELWRTYVDFVIVMSYVVLFLSAKSLINDGGADISQYLLVLIAILVLYLIWGELRRGVYGSQHQFRSETIGLALVGLLAVWGAYQVDQDHIRWLDHAATRNTVALLSAFAILLVYRRRVWKELGTGVQ
jgi:hypothetical protein